MDDLCHFPLFRLLVFRIIFLSLSQFIGDTRLFRVTILKQTCKRKKKVAKSITERNIFNDKYNDKLTMMNFNGEY